MTDAARIDIVPARDAAAPTTRPLRVLIVEDSRTVRAWLCHAIQRDPRLTVAAAVETGEEALRVLDRAAPDVISMDIQLPGINGFETTRRIMSERPTPIVVLAAADSGDDGRISMNALQAGALTVLEKPRGAIGPAYQVIAEKLCASLVAMSQVKVVTQRRLRRASPTDAGAAVAACSTHRRTPPVRMVGIVASTGGPSALLRILRGLPPDFDAPILIVQHMAPAFTSSFTEWLGAACRISVLEPRNGQRPLPGCAYVAPADRHMILRHGVLALTHDEPVAMQRPSGTLLLQSMAMDLGPAAAGIVVTGMGDDGAAGLSDIRKAGGHTIAESEATAVVYGMPAAAVALGAACEVLPLDQIAGRMRELVAR